MGPIVTSLRTDLALNLLRVAWNATLSDVLPADRIVLGNSIGNTPAPKLASPFIYVQPLTLPAFIDAFTDEPVKKTPIEYADTQVVTVDDGRDYKIRVNGYPVKHNATLGETPTDVRDALIAAVDTLGEPVTTSIVDASTFRVTPTTQGSLYDLSSPTDTTRLLVSETLEAEPTVVEYKLGRRRVTLRINTYSDPARTLHQGAHDISNKAYDSLEDPAVMRFFNDYRMTFRPISEPLNLTGKRASESGKEQRASFDLSLELPILSVFPAKTIESVDLTLEMTGAQSAPIDVPITIP